MITPTFRITDIKLRTKGVMRAVRQASVKPAMKAALLVERDAKASMKMGGGYKASQGMRKGKSARRGKPSRPGTPPNVQRGELRASITHARSGWGAITGPTIWYGQIHEQKDKVGDWAEFGGRHYPKRAFMRPALERMKGKFARFWRNLKLR